MTQERPFFDFGRGKLVKIDQETSQSKVLPQEEADSYFLKTLKKRFPDLDTLKEAWIIGTELPS